MRVGGAVDIKEIEMIAAKLGVFRKECKVLVDECAKSAADFCIMKMRIGALVDKLDKRTILKSEIAGLGRVEKELWEKIHAFRSQETDCRQPFLYYRRQPMKIFVNHDNHNVIFAEDWT